CTWVWEIQDDSFLGDRRFPSFFGIDEAAFGGTLEAFLALADANDQAELREAFRGTVGTKSRIETEFRVAAGSGTSRFVVLRADIDRDRTGRAVRLVGVCI